MSVDAALDLVVDGSTLDALVVIEASGLSLNHTLENVTTLAIVFEELLIGVSQPLGRVVLSSTITLGEAPPLPIVPRIYNLTGKVQATGGTLLCFVGFPHRTVEWRVIEGLGTLTPFTTYTDAFGRATARFDASGIAGRVVVGVAYIP